MSALSLAWQYLTGSAVATHPTSRDEPEWPPHPARVFMALAAAWFETQPVDDEAARNIWLTEGESLRWLESLPEPSLHLPIVGKDSQRTNITVYVPVNDRAEPSTSSLQSAPAFCRVRQPRTFPRIWVGDQPCYMLWTDVEGVDIHEEALQRLCAKVTRIGHSSSLVRMWLATSRAGTEHSDITGEFWHPSEALPECQLRRFSPGMLQSLKDWFNQEDRTRHEQLSAKKDALTKEKKDVTGKGAKERRAAIDEQIAAITEEAEQLNPRPPIRPSCGLWTGYQRENRQPPATLVHSQYDADILILVGDGKSQFPLASTQILTHALRGTIMSHCNPPPAWISGHTADGRPLGAHDDGHIALIPLPFVGRENADGHVVGLGLVFPRSVDRRERGSTLGSLVVSPNGTPKPVTLKLGAAGEWKLQKRHWSEKRRAVTAETWTANPDGATVWASVTPVVLDRFPKSNRARDRQAWTNEVATIVASSCERIGLPTPAAIDIDTTCWHRGSPRAVTKRRPLRGGASSACDAPLGNGFPPLPRKGTNGDRPQVHVWIEFPKPVIGPVLLGAGRYRGYGLCKPVKENHR